MTSVDNERGMTIEQLQKAQEKWAQEQQEKIDFIHKQGRKGKWKPTLKN